MLPALPPPFDPDAPLYYRPPEVELCKDAARNGDLNRVRELVQQLLHQPRPQSERLRPDPCWLFGSMIAAIERRDLDMVQFLLDEKVTDPNVHVAESAVRSRAFEILELFMQRGWDVNEPTNRAEPPVLSVALCTGDKEMATWLLDHGADPNAPCAWDYTPTSEAMLGAPLRLIDYLFTRGADAQRGELLQWAVHRDPADALEAVRCAVEHGSPINKVKYEDQPATFRERKVLGLGAPLHRAAEVGSLEIVNYLLEHGADPLKLDSRGKKPSHWANVQGHPDVAAVLFHAEGQWATMPKEMSNL